MRFRVRHVQQTLVNHLRTELQALDWFGPTVPLGTTAVTLLELEPSSIENPDGNVVSVTTGEEGPAVEHELGGMRRVDVPLFVDVYGVKPSISVSLASDVKDILTDLLMPVHDYGLGADSDTDYLEVIEVGIDRPPNSYGALDFKRNWRVVRGQVFVYYLES